MSSRTVAGAGTVAALVLLGLTGPAGLVDAASARVAPSCTSTSEEDVIPVVGDVNADGTGDLAVGLPAAADQDGQVTGALDVYLTGGGRQRVTPTSLGVSDDIGAEFGSSTTLSDLDHDSCADLVVGAPGEGAVYLVRGSANGVTAQGIVRIASPGASGDRFGLSVAATVREVGGATDLWVGAPTTTVSGRALAGRVYHYVVSANGSPSLVSSVDFTDLPGAVATDDRFGQRLAPTFDGVAVGVPRRAVGGRSDAGVVAVLHQEAGPLTVQMFSQSTPGVPGAAEAGDGFGSAVSTGPYGGPLLVGVPGEDIGTVSDAGSAQVLGVRGRSFVPSIEVHQGVRGIPGPSEAGDHFGAAVSVGRATSCQEATGYAVGAPGEDVGRIRDAGSVTVFADDPDFPCPVRLYRQGTSLGGTPEAGDQVGAALSNRRYRDDFDEDVYDTLLVGVPGEDASAGVVQVATGGSLSPIGSAPKGARFGTYLASDAAGPSF